MVSWLRQNGVTTSEPWTRDGVKGLLYFRDPAGNLFEMYCRKLNDAATFARGIKQGGSYTLDIAIGAMGHYFVADKDDCRH